MRFDQISLNTAQARHRKLVGRILTGALVAGGAGTAGGFPVSFYLTNGGFKSWSFVDSAVDFLFAFFAFLGVMLSLAASRPTARWVDVDAQQIRFDYESGRSWSVQRAEFNAPPRSMWSLAWNDPSQPPLRLLVAPTNPSGVASLGMWAISRFTYTPITQEVYRAVVEQARALGFTVTEGIVDRRGLKTVFTAPKPL